VRGWGYQGFITGGSSDPFMRFSSNTQANRLAVTRKNRPVMP
jgi:hypothetical protein